MGNHCIITPNSILKNRLFFELFHFLHNVVWYQRLNELYERAVLVTCKNYGHNTIPTYKKFQLLFIETGKFIGPKMTKMTVLVVRCYFVVQKKP